MFFWHFVFSVNDSSFFLVTIPNLTIKTISIFDTITSRVKLIGFFTPNAAWVSIAFLDGSEVLGANSGIFFLVVWQVREFGSLVVKRVGVFDLIENRFELLSLVL